VPLALPFDTSVFSVYIKGMLWYNFKKVSTYFLRIFGGLRIHDAHYGSEELQFQGLFFPQTNEKKLSSMLDKASKIMFDKSTNQHP
jgi:hypothetical protein